VPQDGQQWLTLDGLAQEDQQTVLKENEPELIEIKTEPKVGIGQTAQLVVAHKGLLLWDPVGYVDDSAVKAALKRGPVLAIAASHPHMFDVQVEWSHSVRYARTDEIPRFIVGPHTNGLLQRRSGGTGTIAGCREYRDQPVTRAGS
jgi:hypothetical protein